MIARPLRNVLLMAGAALPFVLHAPGARAADPTINDILNTMQQLGVQIPGLGPVGADCDNAENQAAVRLRDHGQSLGLVRDSIDRLASAPASVPPADIADGASQIASQARQIAQDIDSFVPQYEQVMISCGRQPSSSQQLSILSSSFKSEARRAESIASAALATPAPTTPTTPLPGTQPGNPPPLTGQECDRIVAELRGAEGNAASFVADTRQVVTNLEGLPPSNRRARDAGRVVEDIKARRASLNDLLTRSDPGIGQPCNQTLAQLRTTLLGHASSLQDLQARASVIAGLAPPTEATPTPPVPAEPALTRDERIRIQQALQALSFYRGTIDADFGRGTRAAIRAWQESQGIDATGYLTRAQADRLIAVQVSLPAPAPTTPTTPAPAPSTPATPAPVATGVLLPEISATDIVATLDDEIVGWSLPPQLSPAPTDDDARTFATFYERMRQRADDGDTAVVRFAAPTLAGMALLDHGADSLELADALMLIAQIRQAEGDEAGAATLLAQARGIVEALASTTDRRARRAANAALAWVVLRQATSDLVASLTDDDRLTNSETRRIAGEIEDATARVTNAGDGARDFRAELLVLQAAFAVAADRPPTDPAVVDEIDRLFND